MRFDRDRFFASYATELGRLAPAARVGLERLLDAFEADPYLEDLRHVAYMLATIHRECAGKFRPIPEYGKGRGRAYARVYAVRDERGRAQTVVYYGRGLVQLTWRENYVKATVEVRRQYPDVVARFEARSGERFDLGLRPHQALDPEISYAIMSAGMRQGWFAKGQTLARYINASRCEFRGARRIINGTDHAGEIADVADRFVRVLRASLVGEEPTPQAPPVATPPAPVLRAAAAVAGAGATSVAGAASGFGLASWITIAIAVGAVALVAVVVIAVLGFIAYRWAEDRGLLDRGASS